MWVSRLEAKDNIAFTGSRGRRRLGAGERPGNVGPRGKKVPAGTHFISHDKNYTEIVRPFELHGLFARTGAQFALYLLALFGKLFLALAHLYSV